MILINRYSCQEYVPILQSPGVEEVKVWYKIPYNALSGFMTHGYKSLETLNGILVSSTLVF